MTLRQNQAFHGSRRPRSTHYPYISRYKICSYRLHSARVTTSACWEPVLRPPLPVRELVAHIGFIDQESDAEAEKWVQLEAGKARQARR